MINYKMPKLVKLYAVHNGNIQFVCSCGRLATTPLRDFTDRSRCVMCNNLNKSLAQRNTLSSDALKELFTILLNNGLYTYVNNLGK